MTAMAVLIVIGIAFLLVALAWHSHETTETLLTVRELLRLEQERGREDRDRAREQCPGPRRWISLGERTSATEAIGKTVPSGGTEQDEAWRKSVLDHVKRGAEE